MILTKYTLISTQPLWHQISYPSFMQSSNITLILPMLPKLVQMKAILQGTNCAFVSSKPLVVTMFQCKLGGGNGERSPKRGPPIFLL
jgi:hypothetical protein